METRSSYKKTLKNTFVIGGAQVVQMLATLVRAKIVAIFLGPTGMGIHSIFISAIAIIQQIASLGIFQSGVREMSYLYGVNKAELSSFRHGFLKLSWFSGLAGCFLFACFSFFLSKLSFGNGDYATWFLCASAALIFMSMYNGNTTIMQATQNLDKMAKSTIWASCLGIAFTVGAIYLFGLKGVVVVIVLNQLLFFIVSWYYERKIQFEKVVLYSWNEFRAQMTPVMKLGYVLMLGTTLITGFSFLLNIVIRHVGGVNSVGYYQAAASICMQAMVIINVLLASDYFPRLSAVSDNAAQMQKIANEQTEIMFYIIGPVTVGLIVFAPLLVTVLLSKEFSIVVPLIQTMAMSLLFRVLWLVLSYLLLAKGNKKLYFIYDAVIGNGLNFILNAATFYFAGLSGLGYSYIAGAAFMAILLGALMKFKYGFVFQKAILINFATILILIVAAYLAPKIISGTGLCFLNAVILLLVIVYSLIMLNKKINVIDMIIAKVGLKK